MSRTSSEVFPLAEIDDLCMSEREGQVFGGTFRWTDRRVYTAFALPSQ